MTTNKVTADPVLCIEWDCGNVAVVFFDDGTRWCAHCYEDRCDFEREPDEESEGAE